MNAKNARKLSDIVSNNNGYLKLNNALNIIKIEASRGSYHVDLEPEYYCIIENLKRLKYTVKILHSNYIRVYW